MKPFSPLMYMDDVTFYRCTGWVTAPNGSTMPDYPAEGVAMRADVHRSPVTGADQSGRMVTTTTHLVGTPTDVAALRGDRFVFLDHVLTVEGHTEQEGIGPVHWVTGCLGDTLMATTEYVRRDAEVIHAILYDGTNIEDVRQFVIDHLTDGRKLKVLGPDSYLQAVGLDRFEIIGKEAFEMVYVPNPGTHAREDQP